MQSMSGHVILPREAPREGGKEFFNAVRQKIYEIKLALDCFIFNQQKKRITFPLFSWTRNETFPVLCHLTHCKQPQDTGGARSPKKIGGSSDWTSPGSATCKGSEATNTSSTSSAEHFSSFYFITSLAAALENYYKRVYTMSVSKSYRDNFSHDMNKIMLCFSCYKWNFNNITRKKSLVCEQRRRVPENNYIFEYPWNLV